MKINKNTQKALKNAKNNLAKRTGAKVAKVAKVKSAKLTGNFWKKLKESGSYKYGVKLYALRGSDYTGQALTEWASVKGAERKLVLFVDGVRGLAMMLVNAKGAIVRVSDSQGFDSAQIKSARLMSLNEAIALVKTKGRAEKSFNYDGRKMAGHLLDNGKFYSVFTDGKNLFEGEASVLAGKGEEQKRHVWSLGGK